MSPLVQHRRAAAPPKPEPTAQSWGMLLFESLSAGVMAVFVGFAAVLAVVGLFVVIIWPLTFWDLASLRLEDYSSWVNPILWSVFAGGSLAGLSCFSGAAFKTKQRQTARTPARPPRST